MAIAKYKPDTPVTETTTPETILEPRDSNFTTLIPEATGVSLLKYVEGFPWSVDFYGQIVSKSTTLSTYDPSIVNLNNPYYEIKQLILQVVSPLQSNYDNATGVTTIEGTALAPYGVIPNVGDVFITNVDTGEDGIFIINNVTRKTYRKDTIYEVSYHLLGYKNVNLDIYNGLISKIQNTYYFNKDSNYFNRDNLVTPVVKEAIDQLNAFMYQSKEFYFSVFKLKGIGGVFIPNKDYKIYDPLLVDFIMKTVNIDSNLSNLALFNSNNDNILKQPSILTAIVTRNISYLNTVNKRYKFIPSISLNNKSKFGTYTVAGIDYVLYPIDPTDKHTVDKLYDATKVHTDINISTSDNNTNYNETIETVTGNMLLLPSIFQDDYYIVSENFYTYQTDKTVEISYIELLVYKYLNNIAITKKDLVVGIQNYERWDSLQQFYYIPVMWQIIKNYM